MHMLPSFCLFDFKASFTQLADTGEISGGQLSVKRPEPWQSSLWIAGGCEVSGILARPYRR